MPSQPAPCPTVFREWDEYQAAQALSLIHIFTAVSGGTIHVLVTDGTKKGVCIVRVTASGSLPAAPSGGDNGSGGAHKLNQEDFTRPVREGPYQLKVSGVTTAITWTSSDTSVATVSSTGLVTPVGAGTATITASWDGQSLSCIVRVPG